LECGFDMDDDICGSLGRVLIVACGVDGIVDFAAGELGHDILVHGDEAGGGTLLLAGAPGVDDGCDWMSMLGKGECGVRVWLSYCSWSTCLMSWSRYWCWCWTLSWQLGSSCRRWDRRRCKWYRERQGCKQ
jgi:hypothetical protein